MFCDRQMTQTTMLKTCTLVIALPLLSVLSGTSHGGVRDHHTGHQHQTFSRQLKGHDNKSQGPSLDFAFRRQHHKNQNTANDDRHHNLVDVFNGHFEGFGGTRGQLHSQHEVNHHRGHQLGFKPSKGHHRRVSTLIKPPGMDKEFRKISRQELRPRRSSPSRRPIEVKLEGVRLPQGITYTWTRDVGTGRIFNEAAFKSKDKNVVVILSFDDALKDANLTASATLYDFTGATGVMAIKPRMRPGPCFLVETSLTYDKIIGDLNTRNGSSVSTSTVISLDGTGSPVTLEERQGMLKRTPTLSRQCRRREIIRTKRIGFSPITYDGQTKELKLLTMDAELAIIVPAELDLEAVPFGHGFQGGVKGPGHGKGQGIWKGQ